MNFDPVTGQPIKKSGPPLPNTRTTLFHPTRPEIVVEGSGTTPQELKRTLEAEIQKKEKEGYLRERPHGQHPHSLDPDRIHMQEQAAKDGDKKAKEALVAKGVIEDPKHKKSDGI